MSIPGPLGQALAQRPSDAPGSHAGSKPDKHSTRVSWWSYEQAPADVQAMANKLWPVRDDRVEWWVGCCSAEQNPQGFPLFMHTIKVTRRGPYWWSIAFRKNAQVRYALLDECEAKAV